ncbi:LicD family-domain-containing protein, partial [Zopfochytrium polystomum]
ALPTTLRDLLASFSRLADSTFSPWWIAHGTLLGWWWGGAVLPWDDDVDVQMTLSDLLLLASRRNGTVWEGRYLFEVNPSVLVRYHERENTLDARFIDTVTGRMVDVTALAGDGGGRGDEREKEGGGGREAVPAVAACKSPHRYATREMFPLRRSVFEGVDVWVPYDARAVLVAEYGVASVGADRVQGLCVQRNGAAVGAACGEEAAVGGCCRYRGEAEP